MSIYYYSSLITDLSSCFLDIYIESRKGVIKVPELQKRFIDNYFRKMRLLYPEMEEKKLLDIITKLVQERYTPLEGHLYNNYENTDDDMTNEEMVEKIEKENIITSGRGILFKQHDETLNPSLMILQDIQKQRKNEKKLMFKAIEEGNREDEKYHDIRQKIYKLYMNSWCALR